MLAEKQTGLIRLHFCMAYNLETNEKVKKQTNHKRGTRFSYLRKVQGYVCWSISTSLSYSGTYFIRSCQQIVCHLLQVRGFSCIYEAHHFLKDIWVHITDVNAVLEGETRGFRITRLNLASVKHPVKKTHFSWVSVSVHSKHDKAFWAMITVHVQCSRGICNMTSY